MVFASLPFFCMRKLKFRTLILSDVHLGTSDCKIAEVNHLLKGVHCDKLILNGDIIDGWSLRKGGKWTKEHSRFVRLVLKKLEKKNTEVVYLRGNHDDILARFLPLHFENLKLVEEHIHATPRGRYLVVHGDIFDLVSMNLQLLARLGDVGYRWLLSVNRFYNRWRSWRGKGYFSLSQVVKAKVKTAVSFISKFEEQIVALARAKGCKGVICGHIHSAADKYFEEIHYLNSGDWVESLTAIVEDEAGCFELIDYPEFCRRLQQRNQGVEILTGLDSGDDDEEGSSVSPMLSFTQAG